MFGHGGKQKKFNPGCPGHCLDFTD